MSDIAGELKRVMGAFDKPTLKLLDRKWAPFVMAVFKTSFSRDRQSVQCDRMHVQVDTYRDELLSIGDPVPDRSGRALCMQWMNDQWLYRSTNDAGEEEYSLTSHALEALSLVDSLTRDRALLSESRLTTILQTVRRWATEASSVREDRIRRLEDQIVQLTTERDRLAEGGDVFAASDDRMLEGYFDLADLIDQLPSDFKRVEESVTEMHRQIISSFREDDRPIGEVLDEYLAKTDRLMSATAEGRAFEGAFTLLRDDALLLDLKSDLQAILDHPFTVALTTAEKNYLRGTVGVIRQGIDDVLSQRSRLTTTLREHIVNHDIIKERELEVLLRDINKELATWMQSAGPRAAVPLELMPRTLDITHLRERFYDPGVETPPPPLGDTSHDAPEPPSLEDIRMQGGPLLEQLRLAIVAAFADGKTDSVGEAFNGLEPELRRPVEILGLLHMATQIDVLEHEQSAELYETIRPDGSLRDFRVPRMTLNEQETAALAALRSRWEQ
ncbi:DUF3375 family protein [Streptosporangium amethystogenes]|uniref:DUF3375 family protein n=1 Tax=Streptosporangium amethystogenes TaxID=2002 RepID=UPI00068B32AD|nr:DUF3375 family protein [Streptosporangium amethystogenes]